MCKNNGGVCELNMGGSERGGLRFINAKQLINYCIVLFGSFAAMQNCHADTGISNEGASNGDHGDHGDVGPHPVLIQPHTSLFPTVHTAKVVGWKYNEKPTAVAGLSVNSYATDLDHPRWLYVLPNGDVLVAESNAPERPDENKGIKAKVRNKIMKKVGAGVDSPNRIILLRDANHDGVAEIKTTFIQGLNSPLGMALIGNNLYVANTDAVMKFHYVQGALHLDESGSKVVDLPAGTLNHHWTKNIIASTDGTRLYVTVGSNSNAGENGIDKETNRAAIFELSLATNKLRSFATGLRNPVGLAWNPQSGALWTVVNERDELGDNLVPDYMTEVKEGAFYGWPYSYFGQHVDSRVKPPAPERVAQAIAPDYALGSHTASLGLCFYSSDLLPAHYRNGAFIGQHGSWNRSVFAGYRVVFVAFKNGYPNGMPEDVLTGFLNEDGEARGRPVGVAVDKQGAVLVADDVGNRVWRVARSQVPAK